MELEAAEPEEIKSAAKELEVCPEVSIQVPPVGAVDPSPSRYWSNVTSSKWTTLFSPHFGKRRQHRGPGTGSSKRTASTTVDAPERKLTLVALRLAVLEKLATGLGKLAFVWATVVLLGGFVSGLPSSDFWLVSGLLLTEGTRVFSRSNELEWQQTMSSFLPFDDTSKRTWSLGAVHLIPHAKFLSAKTIGLLFYVVQLCSAVISVAVSMDRLVEQTPRSNQTSALTLFYALTLAEASVFLLERAYWEYQLRWKELFHQVNKQCNLGDDSLETIKLFYYKVYSRCLDESVFSSLDMDLVQFSLEKMHSSIRADQLGSVKVLSTLVADNMPLAQETCRRIGTTPGVVERLVEMITWGHEPEILKSVVVIMRSLVQVNSNCFRICASAGALEGITSLLLVESQENEIKQLSLAILKQLARDHRNCVRLGKTSELISILVQLIEVKNAANPLHKGSMRWKVCKKSLQLLQAMAASNGGHFRLSLRKRIASIVHSVKHLKCILELPKGDNSDLQQLAVDVLKSLAIDEEIREHIGATGGVISVLLLLFLDEACIRLSSQAGEVLNLLLFQSHKNSRRMLDDKQGSQAGVSPNLKRMIQMVSRNSRGRIHAAGILRSLCSCLNRDEVAEVATVIPQVLKMMFQTKGQYAGLALVSAIVQLVDDLRVVFTSEEQKRVVAKTLLALVSAEHSHSRTRRYSIELVDALLARDAFFVETFRQDGLMRKHLKCILSNVSDVDNFYTFSGAMGLTRHHLSIEEVITSALDKL